jgi:signal transduction histidine kinase
VSIKAKQVAGVTTLVVVVVAVLSAYHLATLTQLRLEDTASRGEVLANAIFLRAADVVAQGGADPYAALREDGGVRSILEATYGYSQNVIYAMIVDKDGVPVAQEGQRHGAPEDLKPLVTAGPIAQLRAVYSDRRFEVRQKMLAGDQEFGSVFVGVSNSLLRSELRRALLGAGGTVLVALLISSIFAMLLSQWMLRPIHVIQSGLSRLGRGELDVRLDLPEHEFRDLGSSFDAVSAQLSAMGRGESAAASSESRPGASTDLESVMHNLEDAVALFSPRGELIFCNRAMNALHPGAIADLAPDNPIKQIVERTIAGRKSQGPVSITMADSRSRAGQAGSRLDGPVPEPTERLVMSHVIKDTSGRFLGAMVVARNIGYLSQVHSTLNYSRKLSALGRLMAGVAHEVKNPLNAMTIHLELLRQKLAAVREPIAVPAGAGRPARSVDVTKHVDIIGSEIHRLDEVVNGFLKFARPDELKLQPVHLGALVSDVATTAAPEAERRGVTMKVECADNLPEINADPGMLGQALLNLALNACQAMPDGGTLKIGCRPAAGGRVELDVEDTGVGIPPEHLGQIFDLYFTTKEKGSGIGLSMVYRIVQLHDGEVEVESTPGHGTKFRLIFPQA